MKSPVDKKVLNTALKGFIKRLEKTETFALNQAPEICQQMVTGKLIKTGECGLISALFLIIGVVMTVIALQHECVTPGSPTRYFFILLIGVVTGTVALFGLADSISEGLYVKNCPKLFLLKEFRDLVK